MKPGLIFDLDGTLVDSLSGIATSLNHALSGLGLPSHVTADVRRFIGDGSWVLAKRAAPADSPVEAINAIELAFKAHYDASWIHGTFPYEGISELLQHLQKLGHPLAILSNKPHPFTEAIAKAVFPQIAFDVVVGQKPGIPHKPDPTGALEIVRAFGLPAADCILIGDSTIDLETSRNAGLRSIAVTWGYHDRAPLEAAKPDALIDSPAQLIARL